LRQGEQPTRPFRASAGPLWSGVVISFVRQVLDRQHSFLSVILQPYNTAITTAAPGGTIKGGHHAQ
jgi:hypothetical protein